MIHKVYEPSTRARLVIPVEAHCVNGGGVVPSHTSVFVSAGGGVNPLNTRTLKPLHPTAANPNPLTPKTQTPLHPLGAGDV